AQPMQVTEDFESGESFAKEFEGWTFVDLDNGFQGGFQNIDIPGVTPDKTKGSFFVFDNADDAFNLSFATTSGTKFLATLFNYDDSAIDDWAISPILTGDAQTISFFARSYSNDYPEKIEVWYTTSTSVDPADFVKVESFGTKTVPCDADRNFVEYTADLPAGAKRFAIRSCATGSFMLLVDDVTYTALDTFDGELKGYNIYCDGVKLNDAPLTEAAYVHADVDDAAHTYHVTAVYDKGESELSEPVTIDQSGIDAVLAAGIKVAVEGHAIVVTGAEGKLVTINAVDGRTIYSAQGDARVTVNSSIYLVTADRKTVKVIVR
ncbi:MAG: choice-of-anchor J domain-containing protein, partial [Muribaculaceae bacterium]|nr:choice-of-anchor J domain-containing protein [Muribaculaceae bacterium]